MKYTFATPNPESAAREIAMNERWGAPKFGLRRWAGQGLIREAKK